MKIKSFSASLNLCSITCFAVCASILPPASFTFPVSIFSPISESEFIFLASFKDISIELSNTSSTTFLTTYTLKSPVSVSNLTEILCPDFKLSFLNVEDNASSTADNIVSLSKFLSAAS